MPEKKGKIPASLLLMKSLLATVFFQIVEKKILKNYLFYPPTLNIICFVEKNNIFLRFCLCIFESDTVKSDCPMRDLNI